MPDATCFAGPKQLLCRTAALDRIMRAAVWMVSEFNKTGAQSYEKFRLAHREAVMDGFRYADGVLADSTADKLADRIRHEEESESVGSLTTDPETQAHKWIVDFNLAALLGHESSHAFGESCPIEDDQRAQTEGLADRLLKIQLGATLFCPRSPDLIEVRADLCGLRHIRALNRRIDSRPGTSVNRDYVRRAAADMVAFQLLAGWREIASLPRGKYVLLPRSSISTRHFACS